jgi:O-antigen/teichoic acid export membrane protein
MVLNVANLAFHLAVSHLLQPSGYGAAGSLLSLMALVAVPAGAMQATVTRRIASGASTEWLTRHTHILNVAGAATPGVLLMCLSPVLSAYLNLDSTVMVSLFAAYTFALLLGTIPRGVLLGHGRFQLVGLAFAADGAVRCGAGAAMVLATGHAWGAIAGPVLGEAVATAIVMAGTRRGEAPAGSTRLRLDAREALHSAGVHGGLWFLIGSDVVLARHYLSASASGYYAVAATAASVLFFLPAPVTSVAFPRLSASGPGSASSRSVLARALRQVTVLVLPAFAAFILAPGIVVRLVFGAGYLPAAGILRFTAVSYAAMGLIHLLFHHHLARRSAGTMVPWLLALALWGFALAWHRGVTDIAAASATVAVGGVAVLGLCSWRLERPGWLRRPSLASSSRGSAGRCAPR